MTDDKDLCMQKLPLAPKQRRIWDWISAYMKKAGRSPTRAELARAFGVSTVTMYEHLTEMRDKGWITVAPRVHRGISLAKEDPDDRRKLERQIAWLKCYGRHDGGNTTGKQRFVLLAICDYINEHGHIPTQRALTKNLWSIKYKGVIQQVHTTTLFEHLEALRRKGILGVGDQKIPFRPRYRPKDPDAGVDAVLCNRPLLHLFRGGKALVEQRKRQRRAEIERRERERRTCYRTRKWQSIILFDPGEKWMREVLPEILKCAEEARRRNAKAKQASKAASEKRSRGILEKLYRLQRWRKAQREKTFRSR